jgi:transposase
VALEIAHFSVRSVRKFTRLHRPGVNSGVKPSPGRRGFRFQLRLWVVERSFAWLNRNRRLANDYERRVQTSETRIEVATIRLLLRRRSSW